MTIDGMRWNEKCFQTSLYRCVCIFPIYFGKYNLHFNNNQNHANWHQNKGLQFQLPISSCSGESSKISESDGKKGEPG